MIPYHIAHPVRCADCKRGAEGHDVYGRCKAFLRSEHPRVVYSVARVPETAANWRVPA